MLFGILQGMFRNPKIILFLVSIIGTLVILFLSQGFLFQQGVGFFDRFITPIQKQWVTSRTAEEPKTQIDKLRLENEQLRTNLRDKKQLETENKALKDQFQSGVLSSQKLLPATIIGFPSFIPGVSQPEYYILDKGEADGVKKQHVVVVGDNLVGFIDETTIYRSRVRLVTAKDLAFPAKTFESSTLGVVRGKGNGEMVFDNVVLSETLKKGDTILTKGDTDIRGVGIPPDLVIGKITSLDKKASALFQTGNIQSGIVFPTVTTVFILIPES